MNVYGGIDTNSFAQIRLTEGLQDMCHINFGTV